MIADRCLMAARNHMRNMNLGDKAFFYHSNCKEPGIVGTMEIVKEFSEDRKEPRDPPSHPPSFMQRDTHHPQQEALVAREHPTMTPSPQPRTHAGLSSTSPSAKSSPFPST